MTLDATKRPGFLTRVGFLSTFAHSDVTSPILRGAFITGRVFGINPGQPDAKFLLATPPAGNYTTERDAIAAMVANQPCLGCHGTYINPPGFVLEHYNAVGTWQDTDPLGGTINGTADVYFSSTDTKTISSPSDSDDGDRHAAERAVHVRAGVGGVCHATATRTGTTPAPSTR